MFDEVVSRANLGSKILPNQSLVVGRFGPDQTRSVVAICQTLDKLIVHEPSLGAEANLNLGDRDDTFDTSDEFAPSNSVYFIAVRDIIKCISVKTIPIQLDGHSKSPQAAEDGRQASDRSKDLLLTGCVKSILIYDATTRSKLFSVNTTTSIELIAFDPLDSINLINGSHINRSSLINPGELTVCGGPNKLSTLRMSWNLPGSAQVDAELTSERSTDDTISSLLQGIRRGVEHVLTGSEEHKIRLYQIDSFDQNIQSSKLTIQETGKVNCLCTIGTAPDSPVKVESADSSRSDGGRSSILPSLTSANDSNNNSPASFQSSLEMNHFAYGLDNNYIGVYRLFNTWQARDSQTSGHPIEEAQEESISHERLWRHKCKQVPGQMIMYDINGDGLDELIVGFKNGRLEARSPFTGQLLAVTRCFRVSDRLAGLTVISYEHNNSLRLLLAACSVAGSIVLFRPRHFKPKQVLRGYSAGSVQTMMMPMKQQDLLHRHDRSLLLDLDDAFSLANRMKAEDAQASEDNFIVGYEDDRELAASDLHIESKGDECKASKCDSRQNLDLLHKLNALHCKKIDLEKRACQTFRSRILATKLYMTDMNINHRWDLDMEKTFINLIIVISTKMEQVQLLRLEDQSRNMIATGHLLINTSSQSKSIGSSSSNNNNNNNNSQLAVIPLRQTRDEPCRLILRVYSSSSLPASNTRKVSSQSTVSSDIEMRPVAQLSRIHLRAIEVPKYCMFSLLPPSSVVAGEEETESANGSGNDQSSGKTRVSFPLRDSEATKIQLADWLRRNFLLFRFGVLIKSLRMRNMSVDRSSGSFSSEADVLGFLNWRYSDVSQSDVAFEGLSGANFEFRLADLRHTFSRLHPNSSARLKLNLKDAEPDSVSTLRIAISNDELMLEGENADLLVDLIKCLVIDTLDLLGAPTSEGRKSSIILEPSGDFRHILSELDRMVESERQLEESERRIQSELYESADYTKQLVQQLEIANELNEFSIAKEVLNELSIMLNGAQNAARAHQLNNNSRSELSKDINNLRVKINYLTGKSFSAQ